MMIVKKTSITKRIDDLGRIAIPKEIRRLLFGPGNGEGEMMDIFFDRKGILLMPYNSATEEIVVDISFRDHEEKRNNI